MRRGGLMRSTGKFVFAVACLGFAGGCSNSPSNGGIGNTLANLVLFNSTTVPPSSPSPVTKEAPIKVECPDVEVRAGTSSVRVYGGDDQSNSDVRYQFSLDDTARDCHVVDGQLEIKVGVAGRVLLGPVGSPASFTVPVRVVIRRESDDTPAVSKLYRVVATIPEGQTEAGFTVVSDPLTVPLLHHDADRDYTILVGFDRGAGPDKNTRVKLHRRG